MDENGQPVVAGRISRNHNEDDQPLSNRKKRKLERKLFVAKMNGGSGLTGPPVATPHSSGTASSSSKSNSRPALGRILRIIRKDCNLAVVLPSLSKLDSQENLAALNSSGSAVDLNALSSSSVGAKTPIKSEVAKESAGNDSEGDNSEYEESGSSSSSGSESEEEEEDAEEGEKDSNIPHEHHPITPQVVAVNKVDVRKLVVFDRNETREGGRLCIIYGKHYLPHCK